MRIKILFLFLIFSCIGNAQYSFSGNLNVEKTDPSIYLSLIEDYRKISGVYPEQIIAKAKIDSSGFFKFTGNMLSNENAIYRIHTDNCNYGNAPENHFGGQCDYNQEIIFIANNKDTLNFPLSNNKQSFCEIYSTNPNAKAFIRIDSIKEEMKFAYSEVRSKANRKLNNKKWFRTLQDFGKKLNEPLAELYVYSFLSDRSSDLHSHYVNDLKQSDYYNGLKARLKNQYPNSSYVLQYENELNADTHLLDSAEPFSWSFWLYALIVSLIISIGMNFYFISKNKTKKQSNSNDLKAKLTKQEQLVLEHLLQGKSNKAIAEALFVSINTIKTHTNNIYKKLNTQNRSEVKSLFIK